MPTVTPSKTRVTLTLPDEDVEFYQKEAEERGWNLETVMAHRLTRCRAHTASQCLYFNDRQRQELVHLTGGHLLSNADEALQRIRTTISVSFGDVKLDIDQRLAQRIYSRAKSCRMTPEKWLEREGMRSVREACGML